jgi:hypothetical protein
MKKLLAGATLVAAPLILVLGAGTAHADNSADYQLGYNTAVTRFGPTILVGGHDHPFPGQAFHACNAFTQGWYTVPGTVPLVWRDGATDFLQGCMAGAAHQGWQ